MGKTVDSYHFIGGMTKRLVKTWIGLEASRPIPWTPLSKPLSECTVALITSGGVALRTDRPFDQEGEQQNPWWGDPSYRVIPRTVRTEEIRVYHQHIDSSFAEEDVNCLLPIDRLEELADAGIVAGAAPSHYSFMGYLLEPDVFLQDSVPQIISQLRHESVDLAALVPA